MGSNYRERSGISRVWPLSFLCAVLISMVNFPLDVFAKVRCTRDIGRMRLSSEKFGSQLLKLTPMLNVLPLRIFVIADRRV